MKKKILSLCLVLCLAAVAIVGGTLAYFTDTDAETNVFTTGNVAIDLLEEFEQNSKLMPGIDVQKEITVKNTGTETAYVRIHMAIPAILDSGSEDRPEFAAYNNTLHWNFTAASVAKGQWNQHSTLTHADGSYPGWPGNGGKYNCYQQEIDGIMYNVYVITYETALAANETTATPAINKVYLDAGVTNEQMAGILEALGGIKILVVAEGGQVEGFEDAYDALDTQFGTPGTYNPWAK